MISPFDLTPAQQVFAVFYAIFFGTMLSTVGSRRSIPKIKDVEKLKTRGENKRPSEELEFLSKTKLENASLNLFDTPNAWAIGWTKQNKPLIRTILSIMILNILPGIFFAIIFMDLHEIRNINFYQIIFIVWMSLLPQQIYRAFYAILAKCYRKMYLDPSNEKQKKYSKYWDYDLAAVVMLFEDRLRFEAHRNPLNHIAFPVFFYLPSILFFYSILFNIHVSFLISIIFTTSSITLFLIGIMLPLFLRDC